ncbi:glycosyltransferase family 2 protein [Olivibacter sp. SDN3]|uniref:glycosyltransferase n=1 Tax=Olivibacter sp. SDN3 TaxID=2764720 RepID=UPI0016519132|nr:glycosyltransferase family 2 protein [Olivibacter sp. SDN3]QNL51587.1 glycosyltransferase family 2 protein [Olivibacter sp. SDN3]
MSVTASIVLFHNDVQEVREAIESCLSSPLITRLYLIDNSQTDIFRGLATDSRTVYKHCPENRGYGAGHNLALREMLDVADYHLVLNPDISFGAGVLEALVHFMYTNEDVGLVMPKVYYKDGTLQRLCKLLPTPFNLFGRRFAAASSWAEKLNRSYELADFKYDRTVDMPNLSGCFMFMRTAILRKVGGFDPRYFMYLEDIDLVRRIGQKARTVFFPGVAVQHGYRKQSYHNKKLMRIHILSAIKYFNKWGWFFDRWRRQKNRATLGLLQKKK